MAVIQKDLGIATAYGYAKSQGYTGTEEEFAELMASYASVAEQCEAAKEAAQTAQGHAEDAEDAAEAWATGGSSGTPSATNNAKYYADGASDSATTATNKAGEASESASSASGSATSANTNALKAEGYAVGKQNGTDVGSGSTYYHANAKYYKEQASSSATSAGNSATSAGTDALKAEGYAVGKQNGTDVASGSPYYHNNGKYYADEAAASADEAAASAASIDPDTLAHVDGYYDEMSVGSAEQLISNITEHDEVPYNFRTSGGSIDIGDREFDKIVGGTIAWNQLQGDAADNDYTNNGVNYKFANGKLTVKRTASTSNTSYWGNGGADPISFVKDHKYFVSIGNPNYVGNSNTCVFYTAVTYKNFFANEQIWSATQTYIARLNISINADYDIDTVFIPQVFDLTQMFGSTIADYIYSLETANAGAGVAYFRSLFPKPYYAYNAGELMSVKTSEHKLVGFNAWDEEWETGGLNQNGQNSTADNRIRSKNYIPVVSDATYYAKSTGGLFIRCYDADKNHLGIVNSGTRVTNNTFALLKNTHYIRFFTADTAYGGTYKNDICINLSWDGERDGEYEAYSEHVYPLDSDLELRGIPKLDSNNKLYYDGDEYASDGTVTRKYGIVDLGTLGWAKQGTGNDGGTVFQSNLPRKSGDCICSKYTYYGNASWANTKEGTVNTGYVSPMFFISDSNYSDAATFKTAMSGVYLVYELATPTTESADPFTNPQIVNDFGTEEYVDSRTVPIPVGHETDYAGNLRAKIEMAPDSPDNNGDYIVRHNNGVNTYVALTIPQELPNAPTSDGNYRLKCTVSGGTATYSWEVIE